MDKKRILFTLKDGRFRHFYPFNREVVSTSSKNGSRFQRNDAPEGCFSTGNRDLDALIGGGLKKGETLFLEVDKNVPEEVFFTILSMASANYLLHEGSVCFIPPSDIGHNEIMSIPESYGIAEQFNAGFRAISDSLMTKPIQSEQVFITSDALTLEEYFLNAGTIVNKLFQARGKAVLEVIGFDRFDPQPIEKLAALIKMKIRDIKNKQSVCLAVVKYSSSKVADVLGATANIHLKLTEVEGCMVLFGLKPYIEPICIEPDFSEGYPDINLTAII